VIEPSGGIIPIGDLKNSTPRELQIGSFLGEFLGKSSGKIASPCCAQFGVSKEAFYKRSLKKWKSIRSWLKETQLTSSSSGRVLEYTRHMLFGMGAIQ
jgi:Protein of unknown function (DUF3431)